jgi:fido (protein-threonine AMPylation protein)
MMTSTEWMLGVADMMYRVKIRGKRDPNANPPVKRTAMSTAILHIMDDGNGRTIREIAQELTERGFTVLQHSDIRDRLKYLARKGRVSTHKEGRARTWHLESLSGQVAA